MKFYHLLLVVILLSFASVAQSAVAYVKPSGNDANDGLSWNTARKTVQAGVYAAGDGGEVWVAAGTYSEYVMIESDVDLYGGFSGYETERSQRDFRTNATILDGSNINSIQFKCVVLVSVSTPNAVCIDGFTIRKGERWGVYCQYVGSTLNISNNIFDKNAFVHDSLNDNGGAIFSTQGTLNVSNNVIANCISGTGAIYAEKCNFASITNNTIVGNREVAIYAECPAAIHNNIIAYNHSPFSSGGQNSPAIESSNNCIYYNFVNNNLPGNNNINCDPKLSQVYSGVPHIQPGSPCIDAGQDEVVSGCVDIDGQPRILGEHVDIGADESDGTNWVINKSSIKVSPSGNDSNNGQTWESAKKTVQAAVNAANAGDDVWVSAGIYFENITLKAQVSLYGGFAGNETELSQRNWRINKSIIDGNTGVYAATKTAITVSADASLDTRIDGLTIQNAGSWGVGCNGPAAPTISNNIIKSNGWGEGRGAVCCYSGSLIVNNMIFDNGLERSYADFSSAAIEAGVSIITNNTIVKNKLYGISYNQKAIVSNNIIACNYAAANIFTEEVQFDTKPTNNCVFGNIFWNILPGDNNLNVNPRLSNMFNGLPHLQPDSPCIDAGNDNVVDANWTDFDGQTRIIGQHVDIGADESDGTLWQQNNKCIKVSPFGIDTNDGLTWGSPKKTIQAAVDVATAGDEIWVSAGTYTDADYVVTLTDGISIYGGFVGNETARDQRNWRKNETVLDGISSWDKIVIYVDWKATPLTVIDGFTIQNGGNTGIYGGSPSITNNILRNNGSEKQGGALCCNSPWISDNVITGNVSDTGNSSPTYGAINVGYFPVIVNNTIVGNKGVAVRCEGNAKIYNNIIAYNSGAYYNSSVSPCLVDVSSNCLYSNGIFATLPGDKNIYSEPQLSSISRGIPHLMSGSPCIDNGFDGIIDSVWSDIDKQDRIVGQHVDIGADEFDGTEWANARYSIKVRSNGADSNDGLTWATAKKTVQSAIGSARPGDEVWVASGTYTECVTISNNIAVFGGFKGDESSKLQRDWMKNDTILDVHKLGSVVSFENSGEFATIDGFTLRNGSGTSWISGYAGGGVFCKNGSPIVRNNKISLNSAKYGGGIYVAAGNPLLIANVIGNNTASTQGNGGAVYAYSGSSPALIDNLIYRNFGPTSTTGAVNLNTKNFQVINNTIANNYGTGLICAITSPQNGVVCNNIVALNTLGMSVKATYVSNNCVFGNTNGYGNARPVSLNDVIADPLFRNPVGDDYRLMSNSRCINAGKNDPIQSVPFDINGEGRIFGSIVDIGADEYWPELLPIAEAKSVSDGGKISGNSVIVSAVFPDFFYIESENRSAGIRVTKLGSSLSVGSKVSVSGAMSTTTDGERFILADAISGEGNGRVLPVGLTNLSLGGGKQGSQESVWSWKWRSMSGKRQYVWTDSDRLNNIGLLVKVWGTITQIGEGYFYIDDGSSIEDGTKTGNEKNIGIRVDGGSSYSKGEFVVMTGISSCIRGTDGKLIRNLIPVQ